jgi:hypothetical protein
VLKFALMTGVLLAAGLPCSADVVTTWSGQSEDGVVTQRGDWVIIEQDWGNLWLPSRDIKSIVRSAHPLKELPAKLEQAKDDPEALFQIGEWAEQNSLPSRARRIFERVATICPSHDRAKMKLAPKVETPTKQCPDTKKELARRIMRVAKAMVPSESDPKNPGSHQTDNCRGCAMALQWDALADSWEQLATDTQDECLRVVREEQARMYRSFAFQSRQAGCGR